MTRIQKMFNKAVRAIRKQGVACTDTKGDCMYRGPNGLKCIAGHLIPDSLYKTKIENMSIRHVIMEYPELKRYFQNRYSVTENTLKLLDEMQSAHDANLKYYGMEKFEEKIKGVAKEFDLDVPAAH